MNNDVTPKDVVNAVADGNVSHILDYTRTSVLIVASELQASHVDLVNMLGSVGMTNEYRIKVATVIQRESARLYRRVADVIALYADYVEQNIKADSDITKLKTFSLSSDVLASDVPITLDLILSTPDDAPQAS